MVFDDLVKPQPSVSPAAQEFVYDRLLYDTPYSFDSYQEALKARGFKVIEAQEALSIGLATRLFKPEDLESETKAFAENLCSLSQFTVRAVKAMVSEILEGATDETETSDRLREEGFQGSDYIEGRDAFLEKRQAKFTYRRPLRTTSPN